MPTNQRSELDGLRNGTDRSQMCDMAIGALQNLCQILDGEKLKTRQSGSWWRLVVLRKLVIHWAQSPITDFSLSREYIAN